MSQFTAESKTIAFISHAPDTMKALYRRSLLPSKSTIVTIGDAEKVINGYPAMLER